MPLLHRALALSLLPALGFAGLATPAPAAPTDTSAGAPNCQQIRGTAAVTFTTNEGSSLTPTAAELHGVSYTFGLVAPPRVTRMLAAVGSRILVSTDRGCRWSLLANLTARAGGAPLTLTAGPGDRAYAWMDNGAALFRVDGQRITTLRSPAQSIVALGAHPRNPKLVRLADNTGTIWSSKNAGATWTAMGPPPMAGLRVYKAAFDPISFDHAILGSALHGAFVTADGGRTWARSVGLGSLPDANVNVFNAVVSPVDPRVVWAMGIDLAHDDAGRHIYRSVDGGLSFSPVVDDGGGVTLVNGPTMAAHPTDPAVLYFVFGVNYLGTDLYRYDAATDRLTTTHNDYHDISAIAFSSSRPPVMYLGVVSEEIR